jgi:mannose/fructose/N-acetylgalactosamine-specific phosphotransferase system component IIC
MKKLLIATLGLGIALGTISFSFAQDTSDTTKKQNKKKKKSDKTEDEKK